MRQSDGAAIKLQNVAVEHNRALRRVARGWRGAFASAFAMTACSNESTQPTTGTTANVRATSACSTLPAGNQTINFADAAGASIGNATGSTSDMYAVAPGTQVSGSALVSGATTLSSTYAPTWATVPSSNTSFWLYPAGTTVTSASTPIASFALSSVPANGVSSVIFTPSSTVSGPTPFAVNTCQ